MRTWLLVAGGLLATGCQTVNSGPNLVVADQTFDADYFFCHVQPDVIFAKQCGPGDPSRDASGGCHYNVSGMILQARQPVDCGGGDHPVDPTTVGPGSLPEADLQAASLEMDRDYTTAQFYVRPIGNNHPRRVIDPTADQAIVDVIAAWAQK